MLIEKGVQSSSNIVIIIIISIIIIANCNTMLVLKLKAAVKRFSDLFAEFLRYCCPVEIFCFVFCFCYLLILLEFLWHFFDML